MMRKNYIRPVTDVVVISSVHIMAASLEKENRGFSINGGYYEDKDNYSESSDKDYTYNVWRQTDNDFIEID